MRTQQNTRKYGGYAALFSFVVVLTVLGLVVGVFSSLTLKSIFHSRLAAVNLKNIYAAEGFLEDTLRRIYDSTLNDPADGEVLSLNDSIVTVAVTNDSLGKKYSFSAEAQGKYFKKQSIIIDDGGVAASFNYAMQIGAGGLEMGNNSQVKGTIYSNGSVTGGNSGVITGSAFLAATSTLDNVTVNENAQAYRIEDSTISGNATATEVVSSTIDLNVAADTLQNCAIGRNAYYNAISRCTVGGNKVTPISPPANLPVLAFPLSPGQMMLWESAALSGGIIEGGYTPPSNDTTSLGPKKITGDLNLTNKQTLNLTGTVWVQGNLDIDNNSTIKLDQNYGPDSGVIIVDGWVHIKNNGLFSGSGATGSYVMIISRAVGGGHHDSAIDIHNNATGAIFYAPNGAVNLHNGITVSQLTARKIKLGENTVLRYESGLQDLRFTGGSAAQIRIKDWREAN